jgi:Fic family protein
LREHLEAISHMKSIDAIQSIVHRGKILSDDIIIFHTILPQKEKSLLAIKFIEQLSLTNHPIINAALCHLTFIIKNPFDDGLSDEALAKSENGRTSRLLMNLLLLQTDILLQLSKMKKDLHILKRFKMREQLIIIMIFV